MSVICSGDTSVDTACQDDIALNMMKKLFGDDFINAFYIENTPHPAIVEIADGDATILALIASNLSSVAFIAALIIIIITMYKGLINSANDGVAVGFNDKSSLLGLFGRPLFSLAMLMPTVSGFPVIYLIIVFITLTSNGLTNEGFQKYIEKDYKPQSIAARVDDPNYKSANDLMKPAFYGALHGYCVKYANGNLGADMRVKRKDEFYQPETNTRIEAPPMSAMEQYTRSYTLEYIDQGATGVDLWLFTIGNMGINGDICGNFTANHSPGQYINTSGMDDISRISSELTNYVRKIGADISNLRADYAQLAYFDAFQAAAGTLPAPATANMEIPITPTSWCSSVGSRYGGCQPAPNGGRGWSVNPESFPSLPEADRPNVNVILSIAAKHTENLEEAIKRNFLLGRGLAVIEENGSITGATANQGSFQGQVDLLIESTLARGWMAAGTYRTRVQRFRQSLQEALYTKPFNVTFANVSADEDKEEIAAFISHLKTVRENLFAKISESGRLPTYSDLRTEAVVGSFDVKSRDADRIMDDLATDYTQKIFDAEQLLIETITGTNESNNIDALSRMQMAGETIAGLSLALTAMHKLVLTVIAVLQITIGSAGAGFTDFAYDFSTANDAFRNLYLDTLGGWVIEGVDALFSISRLFAVVIPTMPYVFLALAAVGWIMQIIQTSFGMLLFFIMHAIPEKSFVGNQAQGWVTLVSLAFRPMIILAAFFLSFAIYDPVLTYVSQAYFSLHQGIAASGFDNSVARFFIVVSTFKYYWFIYAGIVMMVTYLVFGLVQELGDSVLNWLGTNLLESFGNLETKGVMEKASAGMAAQAAKSGEIKGGVAKTRALTAGGGFGGQQPGAGGAIPQGNPNMGGGGGAAGNQPAGFGGGSRSIGSTGPAPMGGAGNGFTGRGGQLAPTAIITAGSTVTGGVRGAGQGASRTFSNVKSALGGGAVGTAAGFAAAPIGAAGGAVAGAFRGAGRGSRSFLGRAAYQKNLAASAAKGHFGAKGALPVMQANSRFKQIDTAFGRTAPVGSGSVLTTQSSLNRMGLRPNAVSYGGTVAPTQQFTAMERTNTSRGMGGSQKPGVFNRARFAGSKRGGSGLNTRQSA